MKQKIVYTGKYHTYYYTTMESIKKIIDEELAVASQNIYNRVKNINNKPSFIVSMDEILNHPTIINISYYVSEFNNIIKKYDVTDMLDIGKCLDEKNFLLMTGSRIGNLEMCKFLVENGADINDSYALQYSASKGHIEIVKYLVENGADINNTSALLSSACNGHFEIVKYLVENGADINKTSALHLSASNGYIEIVKYLVENGAYMYSTLAVLVSISNGHIEIVKYLIEEGAEFDPTNVLLTSIKNGQTEIFKYLLTKISEIPDNVIDTKINDFNKILFMKVKETQEKLFNPEIVTLYKPIKSLMAN